MRGFSPLGFFPAGYLTCEEFIQLQSIFSAFIRKYIVYGIGQAQLLHVVVKQVSKLDLYLLGHKLKDRFSLYAAHIPVLTF